jgi:hypothetical protein
MSRGHGRVQRAILDYLATDPSGRYKSGAPRDTPLYGVTCAVFGVSQPTDSQRASVRRAVRQLHRTGLIHMEERVPVWGKDDPSWRSYWRRSRYPAPGRELEEVPVSEMHVSRLPTPEEAAAHRDFLRKLWDS